MFRSPVVSSTFFSVALAVSLFIGTLVHPAMTVVSLARAPGVDRVVLVPPLVVAEVVTSTPAVVDLTDAGEPSQPPVVLPSATPLASIENTPTSAVALVAPLPIPLSEIETPTPAPVVGPPHRSGGVPILMYHYVRINPLVADRAGFVLSVTPHDFEQQMRFLVTHAYTTVTIAQIRDYVRLGKPLPPKPIAITFDDGYDDAYTAAAPVLLRNGQTATFYVVTGFVGSLHYLTWEQVTAIDRTGMEVASHTVHHAALPLLGGLALRSELLESQVELARRLGHAILDFCYPGGQLNAASEIAVREAGYLSATTTAYGLANIGDDPLRLPRVRVSGGEGLAEFAHILGENATASDLTTPLLVTPPPTPANRAFMPASMTVVATATSRPR